jgi:hypothetical protein
MSSRFDRHEQRQQAPASAAARPPAAAQRPDTALADMLELIDGLVTLVAAGKRVPLYPGRVLVNVEDFMQLVDELRRALPNEMQQARRVVQERQQILLDAQVEAEKIISVAKERAEYLISDKGVTSEARVRGEDVLRKSKEDAKNSRSEIDMYALRVFEHAERAMREGIDKLAEAKRQVSQTT